MKIFVKIVLLLAVVGGLVYAWMTRDDEVFNTHEEATVAVQQELWAEVGRVLQSYADEAKEKSGKVEENRPDKVAQNIFALSSLEEKVIRDLHLARVKYVGKIDVVDEQFGIENQGVESVEECGEEPIDDEDIEEEVEEEEEEEEEDGGDDIIIPAADWDDLRRQYENWTLVLEEIDRYSTKSEDEVFFDKDQADVLVDWHNELQDEWDTFESTYLMSNTAEETDEDIEFVESDS